MRSLPWPNPHEDGPADELYIPYFENRLLLKVSPATHNFLMSVVAAYVNEEITEPSALSAEILMFTHSWIEADSAPVKRDGLHDFWRTVFKVTRSIA